ncbi:MAG: hypothetical protein WCC25_25360, partial [Candidatus Korobacteraceae bacterium]
LVLLIWRFTTGHIAFDRVTSRRDETFYWLAILVSNTLGTAIGDMTATTLGLGFERGALVFAGLIGLVAALHYLTKLPDSVLFWAAYILTRPLGATLGDTLTKSHSEGGLALGRFTSTLTMIAAMVVVILLTSQRKPAPEAAEEY